MRKYVFTDRDGDYMEARLSSNNADELFLYGPDGVLMPLCEAADLVVHIAKLLDDELMRDVSVQLDEEAQRRTHPVSLTCKGHVVHLQFGAYKDDAGLITLRQNSERLWYGEGSPTPTPAYPRAADALVYTVERLQRTAHAAYRAAFPEGGSQCPE